MTAPLSGKATKGSQGGGNKTPPKGAKGGVRIPLERGDKVGISNHLHRDCARGGCPAVTLPRRHAACLYAFEEHFVGDEGDKLAVGRFLVMVIDSDAEERVDIFYFAAVPSHFYGVADGAFDF